MAVNYKQLVDTAYAVRPGECKCCGRPLTSQEQELGLCDVCRLGYERGARGQRRTV